MSTENTRRVTTIAISQDRADQLRRLAKADRTTPRELIEKWIFDGLKALGVGPDGVPAWVPPGLSARRLSIDGTHLIEFKAPGLPLMLLRVHADEFDHTMTDNPLPEAAEFAGSLEAVAEHNRQWAYDCTKYGGFRIDLRRWGRAVVLRIDPQGQPDGLERENAPKILLTPPTALELADAVRYLAEVGTPPSENLTSTSIKGSELGEAFELAWGDR